MFEAISVFFSSQSYSAFLAFSVIFSIVGFGILTRLIVGHDDIYNMTDEELERARYWANFSHDNPPNRVEIPADAWPDPHSSTPSMRNDEELERAHYWAKFSHDNPPNGVEIPADAWSDHHSSTPSRRKSN